MRIGDVVSAVEDVVEADFPREGEEHTHAKTGERGVVVDEIADDDQVFFMVRWTRTGTSSQHLQRELRVEAKPAGERAVAHPMAGFLRAVD